MPRLKLLAQNVGAHAAKFILWGYRVSEAGLRIVEADGRGCFELVSGIEIQPSDYYRYEATVETTEPVHELEYESPKHAVGKFIIESLEWNDEPLRIRRPIVMHSPIAMARDWKRGRPSRL